MNKQFLKDYGFSDDKIKKLITKKKIDTVYGIVELKGNELITTYHADGTIKKEKIQ